MTTEEALGDLRIANQKIVKRHRYPCGMEEGVDVKDDRARTFFNSPDGQNGELYYELRKLKWGNAKWQAEYYWAVWKENKQIEYVEGDIYITEHKKI